jgi:hypothetical protein
MYIHVIVLISEYMFSILITTECTRIIYFITEIVDKHHLDVL